MRRAVLVTCLLASRALAQNSQVDNDVDRAAAFPDLGGMSMREHMDDDRVNAMVLFDRLEVRNTRQTQFNWDAAAWVGRDANRLLLRTEGRSARGAVTDANLEALWARPVARWWNLVVGARHDFRPQDSRSWVAFGVTGLAPYRLEVQATLYAGEGGRTALQFESAYELLLTNRLILQPRLQVDAYGKDDPGRGIGSGVSEIEAGLRLRYEIRHEFAPYLGVAWVNRFGATADLSRAAGQDARELQALAGLRVWF